MCQCGRSAKPDDVPSLMECAHKCSNKKHIPTERQQIKSTELEYDPPKMNAYLWPREMESAEWYKVNESDKMSPIILQTTHQRAKVRK